MKNKNNKSLKEIYIEAVENYKNKNLKVAEKLCFKILSIDSNHFDSISLLATISAMSRNFEEAKNFLHKAIKLQPKNLSVFNNLGTAYKELGNLNEAMKYYKKALEINSDHTNSNYNLGLVYHKLKELKKAKSYLKKTVEVQKNFAFAFFSLANVHVDLKEYNEAISSYQKAIEINPKIVGAHNNLGLVFRNLNDFENAISCYKKAIELKSDHGGVHHNLAQAFKETGQFDKAIESHQMAIKFEPENLSHYYYLKELNKNILDDSLKNKVTKILSNENCTLNNKIFGNYLLATYDRKEEKYKSELDYLEKGHKNFFQSKREKFNLAIKYCFDDVLQISEGVKSENNNKIKYDKIKPIFIVGVPRCGSTLVEKIIGSGKKMISMGEETAIFENYINQKILEKKSLNLGNVSNIRDDLNDIYKERGLLSKKYDFVFIDKSLNNFFYLKFIKTVYPKAKIINCNRNVLSSIMSIFHNNLTELAWTHDLENIFKYFDNYFNIINNFIAENPNEVYQLDFESLANDPENESKKLMKFCELPWDKKCLEYHKRKDLISKTASNVQIREAIYKHTSNKYLPYKEYLNKYGKKYSWFN
tara:strand:- start:162 stop:1931 length:1770 start_codon:yes stop_codon:yes gene_type:complete